MDGWIRNIFFNASSKFNFLQLKYFTFSKLSLKKFGNISNKCKYLYVNLTNLFPDVHVYTIVCAHTQIMYYLFFSNHKNNLLF